LTFSTQLPCVTRRTAKPLVWTAVASWAIDYWSDYSVTLSARRRAGKQKLAKRPRLTGPRTLDQRI
jgi:hypothetical protein